MYKLTNGTNIIRIADNLTIPADKQNTDYTIYLAWVEADNTALPADTVINQQALVVSSAQLHEQLLDTPWSESILLDVITNFIAASGDRKLQIWFAEATEYHSDNTKVVAMCNALGISEEQKLAIFTAAKLK